MHSDHLLLYPLVWPTVITTFKICSYSTCCHVKMLIFQFHTTGCAGFRCYSSLSLSMKAVNYTVSSHQLVSWVWICWWYDSENDSWPTLRLSRTRSEDLWFYGAMTLYLKWPWFLSFLHSAHSVKWNFRGTGEKHLSLEVGDTVHIEASCEGQRFSPPPTPLWPKPGFPNQHNFFFKKTRMDISNWTKVLNLKMRNSYQESMFKNNCTQY